MFTHAARGRGRHLYWNSVLFHKSYRISISPIEILIVIERRCSHTLFGGHLVFRKGGRYSAVGTQHAEEGGACCITSTPRSIP